MKTDRILFIPDVHRPYHNVRAWNLMVRAMKEWKPKIVVILGDYLEGYGLSRFIKDPRRSDMEFEFADGNKGLDELDSFGAEQKIYVGGNHDSQRFNDYIKQNAPALQGVASLEQALRLKERGWKYVPYRDHAKIGKVYVTHDVGATGRNAAHKVIDVYQHSVITGHTHRMIYAVEADGLGEPILSAQFGWLGDIKYIDYTHRIIATKAYVLGFGIGRIDPKSGILFATPVPIVKYQCMIEGELWKG